MTDIKFILRTAFVLMLAVTTNPAFATQVSRDQANAYFGQCLQNRDERMTADTQEELCACTAAQMMSQMTVEDIKTMGEESPAGRVALNNMLIKVYGPCMAGPVRDLVLGQCNSDPRMALAGQRVDHGALCGCMAERTGAWFSRNGTGLMQQILQEQPYTTDPISPVMESATFKNQSYEHMISCIDSLQ